MRNSKMATKASELRQQRQLDYEHYTHYIDTSAMTIDQYKTRGFLECSKHVQRIEQWLMQSIPSEHNRPLVFHSEEGAGRKTLLIQWYEHHRQQQALKPTGERSLVLLHFGSIGGNNTNYFYAIYRLLIKLREALKIKQKVQLLQQKIRKYFSYWLDVCSNQVEKQLVANDSSEIYSTNMPKIDKIVIVIEGIENFIDGDTGKQSNIAFWLPKTFPRNIKVIVTTTNRSEALSYLKKVGCQTVQLQLSEEVQNQLVKRAMGLESLLGQTKRQQLLRIYEQLMEKEGCRRNCYLFIEMFMNGLLAVSKGSPANDTKTLKNCIEEKLDFTKLRAVRCLEDLYEILIDFWNSQSFCQGKLQILLPTLCLTQKGLTIAQLQDLSGLDETSCRLVFTSFRAVLMQYRDLWLVRDAIFKAVVLKKFNMGESAVQALHEKIADCLDFTSNSIRKLEQQTYHLYASRSYFKLKENISNIENFLLLFNPNNKYDLSRYWQKLEEKGFDPVIEYNKAIEGFTMHYHPTQENIFRIIVQISRFLKQFCDFETYYTPSFRHPPIQGQAIEMDKIGLLGQLQKLNIYVDNSCRNGQTAQETVLFEHLTLDDQIKQLKERYFQTKKTEPSRSILMKSTMTSRVEGGTKPGANINHILNQIQQLNVDVPKNREKFRNYYVQMLKDIINSKEVITGDKGGQTFLQTEEIDEVDSDSETAKKQPVGSSVKRDRVTTSGDRQNKPIRLTDTYNTTEIKPSLYYYKRWIWIQFPWACISLQNDYSTTPQLCLTSATEYMSVESQAEFTRQALKIAIEAKERKKLMFTRKENGSSVSKKTNTASMFATMRRGLPGSQSQALLGTLRQKESAQKLVSTKNRDNLNNINTSLSSLTKQLEARRAALGLPNDNNPTSTTNDECMSEMEFIDKRKAFKMDNILGGISKNQLLPKLKGQIKAHTDYELAYIKSHIEEKKKAINQVIYENNKLANVYRELRIKEMQSGCAFDDPMNRKSRTLQDLQLKKQRTVTDFCRSLLQKERLKIILKLCSQNKTKNEEYLTSLNYLLQNLKKMIKWQSEDMKRREDELQEIQLLNNKTAEAELERQQNEQLLSKQIGQSLKQKRKLEQQINNMSSAIVTEVHTRKVRLESNISGDRLKNEQKTKQLQIEKNTQLIEEQLQNLQNNYSTVASLLEIDGFDYASSTKFKQLMEQKQRNRELNIILFERKNKLQRIQHKNQKLKQSECFTQETTRKQEPSRMTASRWQLSQNGDITVFEDEATATRIVEMQKQLKNLKENTIKMNICFENLAMQLHIKDPSKRENILMEVSNRLQKMKETSEEKYMKFMSETRETAGTLTKTT